MWKKINKILKSGRIDKVIKEQYNGKRKQTKTRKQKSVQR